MPSLKDIQEAHNTYQNSLLYSFESNLQLIVSRAQARVIGKLQLRLKITNGLIDPTPGNMLILRNAGKLFMQELDNAGYSRLVEAFVGEFNGTLPFLQQTVEFLGEQVGAQWPSLGFTAKDLNLLGAVQANSVAAIEGAIESVAGAAITRGLFGVAGLQFGALVETLTEKLGTSIAKARTIADTSMSTWYRTATDRAFQIIQADVPGQVLRYRYSGPDDKLTRPYCEAMLARTKKQGLTREEIYQYPNGQLPNPFLTGGGWACRHSYVISTDQWESDVRAPAVAAHPAAA